MTLNFELLPGTYVINEKKVKWGLGQIQSVINEKITVNFENVGKKVININKVNLKVVNV